MFCKPPCPDEHDLSPAFETADHQPVAKPAQALASRDGFGRLIAPETADPGRGLPPAAVRTG